MFNEVRMFEGQPVRLWSSPPRGKGLNFNPNGRYVIFPNGRMIFVSHFKIAYMPPASAEQEAVAFPPQDQGSRM